jgi:hypothetical protein
MKVDVILGLLNLFKRNTLQLLAKIGEWEKKKKQNSNRHLALAHIMIKTYTSPYKPIREEYQS